MASPKGALREVLALALVLTKKERNKKMLSSVDACVH
jgi:hypothetical protein